MKTANNKQHCCIVTQHQTNIALCPRKYELT